MLKLKKVFNDNRRKIIILLIVFLILMGLELVVENEQEGRVTIFVVDDFTASEQGPNLSHGELVTGIIRALAPRTELLYYQVAEQGGIKEELYLAALEEVLAYQKQFPHQKVLLNISLSFGDYSSAHRALIAELEAEGVGIIAAAGNNNSAEPTYPAAFAEVVGVGSIEGKERSAFSNYGPQVKLVAEGSLRRRTGVYSQFTYFESAGTSFAAPRVTALWALILQNKEELSSAQALELMIDNAQSLKDQKFRANKLGAGAIDKAGTLAQLDPYYWFRANYLYLLSLVVLLLPLSSLIKNWRLGGVIISLLIVIVALPLIALVEGILWPQLLTIYAYLGELGWRLRDYLFLISLSAGFIFFSGWPKRYLGTSYLLLFSILGAVFYRGIIEMVELRPYLMLLLFLMIVVLFAIEGWGALYLKRCERVEILLRALSSKSALWRDLASSKLLLKKGIEQALLKLLKQSKRYEVKISIIKLYLQKGFKLGYLFDLLLQADIKAEFIIKHSAAKEELFSELIEILKGQQRAKKELAAQILGGLISERHLEDLQLALQERELDREFLLRALSNSALQSVELAELLKEIILSENEMWLRYQALVALIKIEPRIEQLVSFCKELKEDTQELVRLEAKEFLEHTRKTL